MPPTNYYGSGLEQGIWGLMIVTYPFISGLVAGSFVVATLSQLFGRKRLAPLAPLAALLSFALLLAAPLTIWGDARQPSRVYELITRMHVPWSPMALFLLIWSSYVVLMLVELYAVFRADNAARAEWADQPLRAKLAGLLTLGVRGRDARSTRRDERIVRWAAGIGILIAFLFHGYIGFIFGSMKSRALWSSPLIPVLFIVSAIVSGIALVQLAYFAVAKWHGWKIDHEVVSELNMWLFGALLLDFYLDMIELLMSGVRAYAPEETYEWFSRLYFHGPLFWTYFLFQLGLGVVLPLIALATKRWRASIVNSGVMAFLVLVGVFMMRWNVVAGGQMASKVTNDIVSFPLVWTGYDSVQTVLGVFGVAFLLFLLFAWMFPWKTGFEHAPTSKAPAPVPPPTLAKTSPAAPSTPVERPVPAPSSTAMGASHVSSTVESQWEGANSGDR
jgi:tetrathionate reductase subunit C